MIVVHHLNNSRSQRILWLLEELGVSYTVKRYERDAKTMLAPPALKAVHPLGKSPVVTDGDKTLVESGAIVEYLVETYGQGRLIPPAGSPERLKYTFWLHYAEGSAMPPLLLKLIFDRVESAPMPFFVKPIAKKIAQTVKRQFVNPQIETHFAFVEDELAKTGWLAGGDFTAADIQMSFPLEGVAARGGATKEKRPNIVAFLDRIHARPAYKAALAKGGPYDILRG